MAVAIVKVAVSSTTMVHLISAKKGIIATRSQRDLASSGIFSSRDGFPSWLKTITDYFPLTYVSHSLRKIANEGVSLADLPVDLIGMGVLTCVDLRFCCRGFSMGVSFFNITSI
ncbi:MAG: hypothetical protein HY015_08180 [Bacteroidetes bacterium]|nr:hypothetical protein [Bacteroidota bacterium]MBI3482934.1 hypothetical protein [Bacteroidota bacterium]MBI3631676.1 hypothetical protein [Candidatus Staskawiczbacteria bacterium]